MICWFIAIMGVFFVTRFYKLYVLPSGLNIDEAGIAYDAWCLSEYGVDRYLKSWPIYLTNYGGGQSSMYAFITAFLFKIFGYSKLMIRITAIIFSFLTLVFGMKLVKRIYPQQRLYPYIYGSIVAIAPYFIMASRFGMDCNLMLGMSIIFIYVFVCALESGETWRYIFAGVMGGLVLYTYVLSYVVLPIFLVFSLLYTLRTKKFELKKWIVMAIPMGLLATPLIAVQVINMFDLPEMQWGIFTITKLTKYRVGELMLPSWKNFQSTLMSIFRGDALVCSSIPEFPVLCTITNILFIIGFCGLLITCIRKCIQKEYYEYSFILFWFVSMVILGTLIEANVNKLNAVYGVVVIIALYGIKILSDIFGKWKWLLGIVVTVGYLVAFGDFATYYYGGAYEADNNPVFLFEEPIGEAYADILARPTLCRKMTQMAQKSIYYAAGVLPSPYDYQNGEELGGIMPGTLGLIEDGYNYIVEDHFTDYMESLREAGFKEIEYTGYSLFYKDE